MPLEGLDEEGLPHNPDLQAAQLKFLLSLEDSQVDKESTWLNLLDVIKEKCKIKFFFFGTFQRQLIALAVSLVVVIYQLFFFYQPWLHSIHLCARNCNVLLIRSYWTK